MCANTIVMCSLVNITRCTKRRGVQILVRFTVLSYTHASGLCAMLITGKSSFWNWFLYTFLLPLYITDTPRTSPSSQEASESSIRLQQVTMVSGHNEEETLPEHVAECERPNNGKSLNVCCELHCLLPNLLVCGACVHSCFYMIGVGHKPR